MGWTLTVSQQVRRHDPTIDVRATDTGFEAIPEADVVRLSVIETDVWEWRAEYVDVEGSHRWVTTGDEDTREAAEVSGRTFVGVTSYEPAAEPVSYPVEL